MGAALRCRPPNDKNLERQNDGAVFAQRLRYGTWARGATLVNALESTPKEFHHLNEYQTAQRVLLSSWVCMAGIAAPIAGTQSAGSM